MSEWMSALSSVRRSARSSAPAGHSRASARLSRLRPLRSDVKPENLLCSRRDGFDRVKLADFGSAMVLPPEGCAAVDPVAQGTTLYSHVKVFVAYHQAILYH